MTPRRAELVAATALSLAFTLAWSIWSWRRGIAMDYGDAQSHLMIARRIFDSAEPDLAQLGTVWLPLPHLLLIPFVQVDSLWHSGAAGAVVGVGAGTVSGISLWRVMWYAGAGRIAAWLAMVLLVSNPAFGYLSSTPLTEPVLLASILVGTAALAKWARSERAYSGGELAVHCGIPAAAAILSRYDGWAWVAGAGVVVGLVSWRRYGSFRYCCNQLVSFSAVPAAAILWWLLFNAIRFGDPLEFQRGQYSAAAQQHLRWVLGVLPEKGHFDVALHTYAASVGASAGWVLAAVGAVGLVALWVRKGLGSEALALWLLTIPFGFYVLSLFGGQSAIVLPEAGTTAGYYNNRYAVVSLPIIAAGVGCLAATLWQLRSAWVRKAAIGSLSVCLSLQLYGQLGDPFANPVLAETGSHAAGNTHAISSARWLGAHWEGGKVLLDEVANPVMWASRVPLKEIVALNSGAAFADAIGSGGEGIEWVYLDRDSPDDKVLQMATKDPRFVDSFTRVHASGPVEVYKRTAGTS